MCSYGTAAVATEGGARRSPRTWRAGPRSHHLPATARPPQSRLTHHSPQARCVCLGQQLLPGHPQAHPALYLLVSRTRLPERHHCPCVVRRLEQSRDELDLIEPDQRSGLLQAHVDLEPIRQNIAVLMPPTRFIGLPGQHDQGIPFRLISDAVHFEQVDDVSLLEADSPKLHAADLRAGCTNRVSGVLPSDSLGLAQSSQLGAEKDAENGRSAPRLNGDHANPPPSNPLRIPLAAPPVEASSQSARAMVLSSARASGLALARYTGDDSACAAGARHVPVKPI